MRKEENVIRYYVLCNKLKSVIRTGWKDRKRSRAYIWSSNVGYSHTVGISI